MEPEYLLKVLLVGDSGVGKSSLLLRFTEDFFEDEITPTVGVDFKIKHINLDGKMVKLTIWDTAGQERFRTLTSSYYRNAHGVILCYDVGRKDTFMNISSWLQEVDLYKNLPNVAKLLVGNKTDLEEREVTRDMGQTFARENGMMFMECSAKTREGVREAFEEIVLKVLDSYDAESAAHKRGLPSERQSQGGGCCM